MVIGRIREPFFRWLLHSGERDGAKRTVPRRVLSLCGIPLLLVALVAASGTIVARRGGLPLYRNAVVLAGVFIAFALLRLRYAVFDYMAFCIFERENATLLRGDDEAQLRQKYVATFGKDKVYRAPEIAAAASLLVFAAVGALVVFL